MSGRGCASSRWPRWWLSCLVLCLCIVWAGYQDASFGLGGAFSLLLGLQAIILVVMGASQVGTSVGGARASGILDFHRVSPLSPTALTLGFFFGAPVREYVLFACTLPFSLLYLAFGVPGVHAFVQVMIVLMASAWLLHGLALLNALLAQARTNPRGVVGLVIFVVLFGGNLAISLSRAAPIFMFITFRLPFYGVRFPWLAVVLLHMGAVLSFVFLAARRKMGTERNHALSKWQSIGALATTAVLLVGSIWKREEDAELEFGSLCALLATAILLILMVTPDRAEYEKGLWRASKRGLAHLPWWDDLALNRVFLAIACGIVLAAATFASTGAIEPATTASQPNMGSFPLAIAAGVLVVAYFGLAHQYFVLRFGGHGKMYLMLFLFLAWILPLVAGTIVLLGSISSSSQGEKATQVIISLSPLAGITLTAFGDDPAPPFEGIRAAVITPALLYTFIFHSLLVSARRRVYKSFRSLRAGWAPS